MNRPAPNTARLRFSLRTLIVLLVVVPPLIAGAWALWPAMRAGWLEYIAPPRAPVVYEEAVLVEEEECTEANDCGDLD